MSSLRHTTTDQRYDETTLNLIAAEAALTWAAMTTHEKTLIRFGMFPAEKMAALEQRFPEVTSGDRSRLCAVALMDCASKDGGMRA